MKDAFWFQHDSNARNDARILELRAELGWEGYGLWWALVEQLREAADYRLCNDRIGGLAMGLGVPKKQLESLLAFCFDLGLLDLEDGYFCAPALCRRMEAWDTKRTALAEAGKRGAARRWAADKPATGELEAMLEPPLGPPHSQAIATPLATPITIREENIREEKSTEQSLPSVEVAADAASEPEKKVGADQPSENLTPGFAHQGGAADVPTRKPKVAKQLLSGDLADLLNPGGVAERVQAMKQPFTQMEADALAAKYGTVAARGIVLEMANYAKLTSNNVSASLTAQKWLEKRQNEQRGSPQAQPAQRNAVGQRPAQSQVSQRQEVLAAAKALLRQ